MTTKQDKLKQQLILAACHPSLSRGQCWCVQCGRTQKVDSRKAFGSGWPKCCGQTMTIDSPEERRALRSRDHSPLLQQGGVVLPGDLPRFTAGSAGTDITVTIGTISVVDGVSTFNATFDDGSKLDYPSTFHSDDPPAGPLYVYCLARWDSTEGWWQFDGKYYVQDEDGVPITSQRAL